MEKSKMGRNLRDVLATIANGFKSCNKALTAARERKFTEHIDDEVTERNYTRAIDFALDRKDVPQAALIAVEAKQYSKAIELYTSIQEWNDAAFVANLTENSELAFKFYKKAGNEYYAARMQENMRPKSA